MCVTIRHGWKAGKLHYDVKNKMELSKIVFFLFPMNPQRRSVSYVTKNTHNKQTMKGKNKKGTDP